MKTEKLCPECKIQILSFKDGFLECDECGYIESSKNYIKGISKNIVNNIVEDIEMRVGLQNEWSEIDFNVVEQIKEDWEEIIYNILDKI